MPTLVLDEPIVKPRLVLDEPTGPIIKTKPHLVPDEPQENPPLLTGLDVPETYRKMGVKEWRPSTWQDPDLQALIKAGRVQTPRVGPVRSDVVSEVKPMNIRKTGMGFIGPGGAWGGATPPKSEFVTKTGQAWKRGGEAIAVDFLYSPTSGVSLKEAQKAETDLQTLNEKDPVEGRNWAEKLWLNTVMMSRPMAEGYFKGAKWGTVAAGATAVAGQTPPLTLTPEELITAPVAFGMGMQAGSLWYWANQGAGMIRKEALKAGLSDKTASIAAAIGGPLYGAIEFSQVDKIIPGFKQQKGGILRRALQYGLKIAQEVGEEGGQKLVTDGATNIGRAIEGQIKLADVPENLKQMGLNAWNEMVQAAGPMALMLIPGEITTTIATAKAREPRVGPVKIEPEVKEPEKMTREIPIATKGKLPVGMVRAYDRIKTEEKQQKVEDRLQQEIDQMDVELAEIQSQAAAGATKTAPTPIQEAPLPPSPQPSVKPEALPKAIEAEQQKAEGRGQEIEAEGGRQKAGGKKERNRAIRETEDKILQHPIYQMEVDAMGEQRQEIDVGYYYVPAKLRGEVVDIIGERKGPPTKLQKMFTFNPDELDRGAVDWTRAVQQARTRAPVEGEYETGGEMEIGDFVHRVKEAHENQAKWGRVNKTALKKAESSGDPDLQMQAEKLRMIKAGFGPDDVDAMIMDWARDLNLELSEVADEFMGEHAKQIVENARIEDEKKAEEDLGRIAERETAEEMQDRAAEAVGEVLGQYGIEIEIEKVEEIETEGRRQKAEDTEEYWGKDYWAKRQKDLLGRPVLEGGAAGKQGEFLAKEEYKLPEPDIEGQEEIPFERQRGRPTGAAIRTPAGRQIIALAIGADTETGYHEAYHTLRPHLTQRDIGILDKQFGGDQEAEARGFAEYAFENKAPTTMVRSIWRKLKLILAKIKSALQGRGFRTWQDIYGEIIRGEIKKAEPIRGRFNLRFEERAESELTGWPIRSASETLSQQGTEAIQPEPITRKGIGEPENKALSEKNQVENLFKDGKNTRDATGDVVKGDVIRWTEAVYSGSFRNPKYVGERTNIAEILDESYGEEKQQHTFSLRILSSTGIEPLTINYKTRRKGRNIYKKGTERLLWADESQRVIATEEKHQRGDFARDERERRRQYEAEFGREVQYETRDEKLRREAERQAVYDAKLARGKAERARIRAGKARRGRLKIKIQDTTPALSPEMAEAAKETEPPPGVPIMFYEPGKRKGPYAQDVKLPAEYYDAYSKRAGIRDILSSVGEGFGNIAKGWYWLSEGVARRLEKIHPELRRMIRTHQQTVMIRQYDSLKVREPLYKKLSRMKLWHRVDFKKLDLAIQAGDWDVADKIAAKYKLNELMAKRQADDEAIYQAEKDVGMDTPYRERHWHRRVKYVDRLYKYLIATYGKTNIEGPYLAALKARKEKAGGRELTVDERAIILDNMIRGYGRRQIGLSEPGGAKERTLFAMDDQIKKFYYNILESDALYVMEAHQAIADREFFGKETRQIQNLLAQRSRYMTQLYKLTKRIGRHDWMEEGKWKESISRRRELLNEVNLTLEQLQHKDLTHTIGDFVGDLTEEKIIDMTQERDIESVLAAYFKPERKRGWVSWYKQGAFITHLHSIYQALTQLEDFGRVMYRAPGTMIPATFRTILRKNNYNVAKDLKITDVGVEFAALSKLLKAQLRATQFSLLDRFMKNVYVDAVMTKYQAQAKNARNLRPGSTFRERIERQMGKDTEQTINDLRENRKTDLTIKLAFNELLDMQPIARSEMTEAYLKSKGGVAAFMTLRTFGFKTIQNIREECLDDIAHGRNVPRALSRLVWMAFTLTLAGASRRALREYMQGRKVEWGWNVVDTWLSNIQMSRYGLTLVKTEGLGKMITDQWITPPMPVPDITFKQLMKGEGAKYVPVVGEPYYWRFGYGKEKEAKKQAAAEKKELGERYKYTPQYEKEKFERERAAMRKKYQQPVKR